MKEIKKVFKIKTYHTKNNRIHEKNWLKEQLTKQYKSIKKLTNIAKKYQFSSLWFQ